MEKDIEYENNNIACGHWGCDGEPFKDCETGCGIKCKNYELCEQVLPKWWFKCKGNYLCRSCHMYFGHWQKRDGTFHTGKGDLEITDNLDCPICFETKKGISHPNCDHTVCIDCFKRCYWGDFSGEPIFPHPEIRNEYDVDTEDPKWNEYPLIKKYEEDHTNWDNVKNEKDENESNLRQCPLCRK